MSLSLQDLGLTFTLLPPEVPMRESCSGSTLSPSAQSPFLPKAFAHPVIHSFPHQSGEAETPREREKRQRGLEKQVPRWEQTLRGDRVGGWRPQTRDRLSRAQSLLARQDCWRAQEILEDQEAASREPSSWTLWDVGVVSVWWDPCPRASGL